MQAAQSGIYFLLLFTLVIYTPLITALILSFTLAAEKKKRVGLFFIYFFIILLLTILLFITLPNAENGYLLFSSLMTLLGGYLLIASFVKRKGF